MAILHCYWHLVVKNGNFTFYWNLVGLLFLIRNERALWRKSKTWNELKYGNFKPTWCPPPTWNCQRKEWALCLSSTIKNGNFTFDWQVTSKLPEWSINEWPFETVNTLYKKYWHRYIETSSQEWQFLSHVYRTLHIWEWSMNGNFTWSDQCSNEVPR